MMENTKSIQEQKETAKGVNDLVDHLIRLLESDGKRYSFCFSCGGTMQIHDKEKDTEYVIHIEPMVYDENGIPTNL